MQDARASTSPPVASTASAAPVSGTPQRILTATPEAAGHAEDDNRLAVAVTVMSASDLDPLTSCMSCSWCASVIAFSFTRRVVRFYPVFYEACLHKRVLSCHCDLFYPLCLLVSKGFSTHNCVSFLARSVEHEIFVTAECAGEQGGRTHGVVWSLSPEWQHTQILRLPRNYMEVCLFSL